MINKFSSAFSDAWSDIEATFNKHHIITTLGWQDVATRYRRSRVGAFWLTINMIVLIATMGFVFGTLFRQPMKEFLPYLAIGLVIWGFLSSLLTEGCSSFIDVSDTILQVRMPLFVHVMRVVWRNLIIFGHNLLIVPLLFLIFLRPLSWHILLALPGLFLFTLNASWMMLVLAVACTRFRDLTQVVQNAIQVIFYLTPIIWNAAQLPQRAGAALLNFNPFYHLMSIVRSPLLGQAPTILNWTFSFVMALIGWCFALLFFSHYRKRIPYWL